jgi:MFS superfamily sulfate permease-like transporter
MSTAIQGRRSGPFAHFASDFTASIVVFLVAMPLCMGIAIASGVPPEMGLVTGIIGGLIVGLFAGSPLQVSGPAAGLAVIVFEFVREHGIAALGPLLVLAGVIQLAAGVLKLGGQFRAI